MRHGRGRVGYVAGAGVLAYEDVPAACGRAIGAPVDRTLPDPEDAGHYRALYPMFRIGRDSR